MSNPLRRGRTLCFHCGAHGLLTLTDSEIRLCRHCQDILCVNCDSKNCPELQTKVAATSEKPPAKSNAHHSLETPVKSNVNVLKVIGLLLLILVVGSLPFAVPWYIYLRFYAPYFYQMCGQIAGQFYAAWPNTDLSYCSYDAYLANHNFDFLRFGSTFLVVVLLFKLGRQFGKKKDTDDDE